MFGNLRRGGSPGAAIHSNPQHSRARHRIPGTWRTRTALRVRASHIKRVVMSLSAERQPSRLPKRFPVGTTYVVEGRGDEGGHLRVLSRYVLLPGGRRIDVAGNFSGPPLARPRER